LPSGLSGILTFVILVGALLFMVRGARGSGGPAKQWRDLKGYEIEGQMWAVALLAGMALGEIVRALEGGVGSFSGFAFVVGVWCGWFRRLTRLSGLVPGTVGGFASVLGSIAFVAAGDTSAEQVFRGALVFALGLLFILSIITRAQPLGGLTWFAALDLVAFFAGPAGVGWTQVGAGAITVLFLASIGVAVALAFVPEFLIALAAFAVIAVQMIGSGVGYLPGSVLYSITPIVFTMIAYALTRMIRRRFAG